MLGVRVPSGVPRRSKVRFAPAFFYPYMKKTMFDGSSQAIFRLRRAFIFPSARTIKGDDFMTLLYDYNISVIIGNYLLRALANDEDLNLNSKKSNFFTKLFRKNK